MDRHMILYRGSLKSCNYHCSYCPFSKHPMSARALEKDREQWFSFIRSFQEKAERMQIGALMVVPYGEAMIHRWYWEGLAHVRVSITTFIRLFSELFLQGKDNISSNKTT